jgi:PIN domain nuclease of toxin-antitoxin system
MVTQTIVLDAHPLIAFLNGEPGADAVRALLTDAAAGLRRPLLSVVNAAEVMYWQEREGGAEASHATLDLLQQLPLELVPIDLELAARAAYFKARGGMSLGDCFAAGLAQRESCPVLTGDREFKRAAGLIEIVWLGGQ